MRTELDLLGLSTYFVGPGFTGGESSRLRLSAIAKRSLVWVEWWWKLGSQSLSLMLKSPVISTVLPRLATLLWRAWRAVWLKSEYMLIIKLMSWQLWKAIMLMSWWLAMSRQRENLSLASCLLMYVATWGKFSLDRSFCMNSVQLGWFDVL